MFVKKQWNTSLTYKNWIEGKKFTNLTSFVVIFSIWFYMGPFSTALHQTIYLTLEIAFNLECIHKERRGILDISSGDRWFWIKLFLTQSTLETIFLAGISFEHISQSNKNWIFFINLMPHKTLFGKVHISK